MKQKILNKSIVTLILIILIITSMTLISKGATKDLNIKQIRNSN